MSELPLVSNILAIRLARLGDIALLFPALGILKGAFPGARLTLLTGLPYEPLARLCPSVDEVVPIDRLGMRDGPRRRALRDIFRLVRELRSGGFDLVVDFHSFRETNLLAWASGARYRVGMKRADRAYLPFCFNLDPEPEDKSLHVSEMFRRVVLRIPGLADKRIEPGPSVRTPEGTGSRSGTLVALYVGASVASRRWPAARFAALAAQLVERWEASVLILAGVSPEEQAIAESIGASVGRPEKVQVRAVLGIPELVGRIASADLLVSNDSGPMHIGSALAVPTLGIFSESLPRHYRPIGPRDRFIWKRRAGDVQVGDVLEILEEMRAGVTGGP